MKEVGVAEMSHLFFDSNRARENIIQKK